MAGALSLHRLTRCFPGTERRAVDDISLEVAPGEVVALVGPSGSGKSTTLRIVAGLERADSGHVALDGRDLTGVPPQDRDVAMVFQGFALYPHMTVRQILEFPLKMRGKSKAERHEQAERIAQMLGLSELMARRPGELSGGEQQRVAMGRAIVRRPKVFLFDEPLSNLDAALRTQLRADLARLLRELGTTALYVTHDQVEAMTLSDRIAVLQRGRIEQCDTPRRIYEAPTSKFVAGFFGSPPMNFLDAERTAEGARAGTTAFPAAPKDAPQELSVGIRPEHLRILEAGQTAPHTLTGNVSAVEPLGAETHVGLDCEGHTLRLRVPGFSPRKVGEPLTCTFSPEHIHWFRRSDGVSL